MNMVLDGMGVAVMPRVMVAGALADGALRILPAAWHPRPLQVAARYHADRTPPMSPAPPNWPATAPEASMLRIEKTFHTHRI